MPTAGRTLFHLTFFFLSFLPWVTSQAYLFDAQLLTTDDGLAKLQTTSVFKDNQGFLWIGTAYGLNRYDGYTFKLFTKEKNGLGIENIHRIAADDAGNLWLFQFDETMKRVGAIDIFDPKTERAVSIKDYFGSRPPPFQIEQVMATKIKDPKNRLWLTTTAGELFLYRQGAFQKIFEKPGTDFQFVSIDAQDNIWLGWERQLVCVNLAGAVLNALTLPHKIYDAWCGEGGRLWLATFQGKKYYREVFFWSLPENGKKLEPFNLGGGSDSIAGARCDYRSNLFVYRTSKGFWYSNIDQNRRCSGQWHIFDEKGNWITNVFNMLEGQDYKAADIVNWFEDGNVFWAATPVGVLKTKITNNIFRVVRNVDKPNTCRSIAEDRTGNIYFINDLIYLWNPRMQQASKVFDPDGATHLLVFEDSILFGGRFNEAFPIFQVDLRTKSLLLHPSQGENNLPYSALKTRTSGRFLVGLTRGMAILDVGQKKMLPFDKYHADEADSLLMNALVYHLHQNPAGIWAATDRGIFLMTEEEGVFRHFNKSTGDLPFDNIRHIHEDAAGIFWLATQGGGIIRWEPPNLASGKSKPNGGKASFRQFTTEDGLSCNYLYAIYENSLGSELWASSDKGLMRINKKTFLVKTYLKEHGLPHNEFNVTSHFQAKDGMLYFGGLGGLVIFHPDSMAEEPVNQTPLAFTAYYLFEKNAREMSDKTHLLNQANHLIIKPGDKWFELQFALLDFDPPANHRYAYLIEGYSDYWQYTNENYVRITNLPYGKYKLRIKGQNSSSDWSERELSLGIRVLKPFYLQGWFIALALGLVAGLILSAVKWRIAYLKKEKEWLEAEVKERTRQLEANNEVITAQAEALQEMDKSKTSFFSNITHEFRTPLTLIIGPLEQLKQENLPLLFKRRLNGVLNNARHLLDLINQLLDISKLEGGRMQVEVSRGDIVHFTYSLVDRFQPLADKKNLRMGFVTNLETWETCFDKDKWNKILYNLISNAIKFTPENGAVQISLGRQVRQGKEHIFLAVKDNGMGISEKSLPHIFDRFYQGDDSSTRSSGGTGIGLALVKELVELEGGSIEVASEVGKGTSFKLWLPVLEQEMTGLVQDYPVEALPLPDYDLTAPAAEISKPDEQTAGLLELLIVEDNEEMREYIRYCLDATKYNITEAGNGEEGLEKALAIIPDIIISDVMMPKMDGYAFTQAIRSNLSTSHIPIILLTAKASLESRLEGLRRGADAYLTKPFSPQELALRIQKLIEIRLLLQKRYQGSLSPEAADETFEQEDAFILELKAYILENLDESDLNGDTIGRHFGMSRVHLYRKLKALTDTSISELVKKIRLEKAMELVREKKLNVSEIAYQTGFSSLSYFSTSFKQAYGKAPTEI